MGRQAFILLIVAGVVAALVPTARAQGPEATVEVIEQPVWHGPNDRLGLTLRVTNDGPETLDGYIVTLGAHFRVLSRSELHASFDEPTTVEASLITAVDEPDAEVAAGDDVDLVIDDPVSSLQSLAVAGESGVYPLTVSLFDASGTALATTTTQLIYYPTPPEFRLPTVPVIPLGDLPRRSPDGTFEATDGGFPLEEATGPRGWLEGLLRTMDRVTTSQPERDRTRRGREDRPTVARPEPLRAGIVVMPRLAEELADMSDGYPRGSDDRVEASDDLSAAAGAAIESMGALVARESVQPVLAPYSFPDLPTLFESLGDEDEALEQLRQQILEAELVLGETLGVSPSRDWVYTPGGRVSLESLEGLYRLEGARFSLFAEDSLEPLEDPTGGGCPEPPLSFTCLVSVTTGEGRATGYVLDRDLQARVGEIALDDENRAPVQRFFAELAMIKEELPSRVDRVVAFSLPTVWTPPQRTSRLILTGLRDAPWLQTLTPAEGVDALTDEIEPAERRVRSTTPRLDDAPDATYWTEVSGAEDVAESFRGLQPPPDLLQRLSRNILVSESRLWWSDPVSTLEGERYASEAAAEVRRELRKIRIAPVNEIGLTSSEAQIPIVVFNDTSYDVSVNVHVRSADLRLDESFSETVQANGLRQLAVDVAAQSSGIFQVSATVETPDGYEITAQQITVRSTAFNEVALGLTFGALAFLILFYVTRALRSRRTPEEPST